MELKRKWASTARASTRPITRVPQSEVHGDFKSLFSETFFDAEYKHVSTFHCIPFTRIRPISQSRVSKLIYLYDRSTEQDGRGNIGHTFGSNTPIVVPLTGTLACSAENNFDEDGCSQNVIFEMLIVFLRVMESSKESTPIRCLNSSKKLTGLEKYGFVCHDIERRFNAWTIQTIGTLPET